MKKISLYAATLLLLAIESTPIQAAAITNQLHMEATESIESNCEESVFSNYPRIGFDWAIELINCCEASVLPITELGQGTPYWNLLQLCEARSNPGSLENIDCVHPEQIDYLTTCNGIEVEIIDNQATISQCRPRDSEGCSEEFYEEPKVINNPDGTVTIECCTQQTQEICGCPDEAHEYTSNISCESLPKYSDNNRGIFNNCITAEQINALSEINITGTLSNNVFTSDGTNSWTAPLCTCEDINPSEDPRGVPEFREDEPSEDIPDEITEETPSQTDPADETYSASTSISFCLADEQDNRNICTHENEIIYSDHAQTYNPNRTPWFQSETGNNPLNWSCYQDLNEIYYEAVISQKLELHKAREKMVPCLKQLTMSWLDSDIGKISIAQLRYDSTETAKHTSINQDEVNITMSDEDELISITSTDIENEVIEPVIIQIRVASPSLKGGGIGCNLQSSLQKGDYAPIIIMLVNLFNILLWTRKRKTR